MSANIVAKAFKPKLMLILIPMTGYDVCIFFFFFLKYRLPVVFISFLKVMSLTCACEFWCLMNDEKDHQCCINT